MRPDLVTAEAPVNGFAMLNHCDILHLSASVSEEAMGLAWSLLKASDPSLPDGLLLAPLRHHAMLAHLCDVRRGFEGTLASCGSAAVAAALLQRQQRCSFPTTAACCQMPPLHAHPE